MLNALFALLLQGLGAEEFERLHRRLQPPRDEPWLSIPWKISLLEARDLAAAEKKPILLWSMDGNPLAAGWNNVIIGRVSVFSDPEVVELLRTRFVPVAVDNHHIEKRKDPEGDFYRKVARRQGEYICTPEGKLLGATNTHSADHLKGLLRKALKDYQPPDATPAAAGPADPRFHRTVPEGGLVVRVTTRVLGGYPPGEDKKIKIYQESLGRDSLWLEKADVDDLAAGRISDSLRARIASYHLVDNTRGEPPWWRAGEVKKFELSMADGTITGAVHLETESGDRGFAADLRGVVERKDGKVTRFDLVARGEAWGAGRWNGGQPPGRYPLAVAFTLVDPAREADRVLPQGACRGNLGGYFGAK